MSIEELKKELEGSTRDVIQAKLKELNIDTWNGDDNKAINIANAIEAYQKLIEIQSQSDLGEEVDTTDTPNETLENPTTSKKEGESEETDPLDEDEEEELVKEAVQEMEEELEFLTKALVRARANFNNNPPKIKKDVIGKNIESYEARISELKESLGL